MDRGRIGDPTCDDPAGGSVMGGELSLDFLVTSMIVVAAVGCTLGIVPHMLAAVLGLAALLHASALAFQTLKYLGVAYLLYMAWNALREKGALRVDAKVDTRSALQV